MSPSSAHPKDFAQATALPGVSKIVVTRLGCFDVKQNQILDSEASDEILKQT